MSLGGFSGVGEHLTRHLGRGGLWPREIGTILSFWRFFPQFYIIFSSNLAKLTTSDIRQLCVLNTIKVLRCENSQECDFWGLTCHLSFS